MRNMIQAINLKRSALVPCRLVRAALNGTTNQQVADPSQPLKFGVSPAPSITGSSSPASPQTTPLTVPAGSSSCNPPVPLLCPGLILAHCESWFVIPLEALEEPIHDFDILGLSGKSILHASVHSPGPIGDFCQIKICMSDLRILASLSNSCKQDDSVVFEVFNALSQRFGYMKCASTDRTSSNMYDFIRGETRLLSTQLDSQLGQLFFVGDQGTIARASIRDNRNLEICVCPNMDAVLVLACLIGTAVLCKDKRPMMGS